VRVFCRTLAIMSALMITAACSEAAAIERFISSGERLASLPRSCSGTKVDRYEKVKTDNFNDGERFELSISATCSEDWRRSLSEQDNLICDEDIDAPGPGKASIYFCLDQNADSQTWVIFDDSTHVEFLWMKV